MATINLLRTVTVEIPKEVADYLYRHSDGISYYRIDLVEVRDSYEVIGYRVYRSVGSTEEHICNICGRPYREICDRFYYYPFGVDECWLRVCSDCIGEAYYEEYSTYDEAVGGFSRVLNEVEEEVGSMLKKLEEVL